ncbi:YkvA family protein [Apibacter adventoris]|uniref:DUF1232 domain-containing protein n=1 Tax=Apibacter adventoris TaxID=1679466 RepID=A0A2S8AF10_9FLAO|nr:DUF1232 domain-containing protein [Apibacter adventoris]PQL94101.1 hypothetical protein C4S77_03870 [Apibacter adventoris]
MKAKTIINIVSKDKSFLTKIPQLFKMLRQSLQGKYKPGRNNIFIFSFLMLYLLSPIDLIPDFIIGIGFLDDITIAFFALNKLFREVDKFTEWQKKKDSVITIE